MNRHSLIPSRSMLSMLCGLTMATGIVMTPARADLWDKKTILTVSQTVQVTDTVLPPGQYVMKLLNSQSDRHVVQIFNRDETHIIDTVIAIPRQRLVPTAHTAFTFYETAPGAARALRTWFYPGDLVGQQFLYPKHLQMLAMLTTPVSPLNPATTETAPAAVEPLAPEPAADAQTAGQPVEQQSSEQQSSLQPATEVAENTAPAETQAPADTAAQPAPSQSSELPKTGSSFPAIGLAGALLIGLAGLMRFRRTA